MPEANSKKYNVEFLRKHGCESFKVTRELEGGDVDFPFKVPADGSVPNANLRNGVSKQEVASDTRTY